MMCFARRIGLIRIDCARNSSPIPGRGHNFNTRLRGLPLFQRAVTLVTTLLDAEAYPSEDLAERYFRRWEVELDFRHVKTTMQMDVSRGKSPDIVRKEIWTHLLANNLIRSVMHAAAIRAPGSS